jgi:S-adenosylmethionine-dependent methyltransferase
MRKRLTDVRNRINALLVPAPLKTHFRTLAKEREQPLTRCIVDNFLTGDYFPPGYSGTEAGRRDLEDHLFGRLDEGRVTVIPWLDTLYPLKGAHILEIGCGPGASTIALAEQGAQVTSVEMYAPWLKIARERCRLYDLDVAFHEMNAADVGMLNIENFDMVLFFACIEHMTLQEKLRALGTVWARLKPGGHLAVVHTPNRLWWYDFHTSRLPFFNWLPDDLAMHYSRHSPRQPFNTEFRPPISDAMTDKFTRVGRAASYHEFELAVPGLRSLDISCMNAWLRKRNPLQYLKWFFCDKRFQNTISRLGPDLPEAFYAPGLSFSIRKPLPHK